jgi:hypothetical protein
MKVSVKMTIGRARFLRVFRENPSIVRRIEGLTQNTVIDLFKSVSVSRWPVVYACLPAKWKTLAVSRLYMQRMLEKRLDAVGDIPKKIIAQFSAADRKLVLENGKNDEILCLPAMTSAEWCQVFRNRGFCNAEKIPPESWTREMIEEALRQEHSLDDVDGDKLAHLFDPGFALATAQIGVDALFLIPKKMITNAVLRTALLNHLTADDYLDLADIRTKGEIPADAWDPDIVKLCIQLDSDNIRRIPRRHIKSEHKVLAARNGYLDRFIASDYQAVITYLACNDAGRGSYRALVRKVLKKKSTRKIFTDCLGVTECETDEIMDNMRTIGRTLDESDLVAGIKVNPDLITELEKDSQTPAMIDALVCSAPAEKIDELADSISLSKITADHALVLIGCKDRKLIKVINGFLRGRQRKAGTGHRTRRAGFILRLSDKDSLEFPELFQDNNKGASV